MVNVAKKYKNLILMIEKAISACSGTGLRQAKQNLGEALRAVKKAQSKNNSEKNETQHKWSFDITTSSLKGMTTSQTNNALGKIEQMIQEEKSSFKE